VVNTANIVCFPEHRDRYFVGRHKPFVGARSHPPVPKLAKRPVVCYIFNTRDMSFRAYNCMGQKYRSPVSPSPKRLLSLNAAFIAYFRVGLLSVYTSDAVHAATMTVSQYTLAHITVIACGDCGLFTDNLALFLHDYCHPFLRQLYKFSVISVSL